MGQFTFRLLVLLKWDVVDLAPWRQRQRMVGQDSEIDTGVGGTWLTAPQRRRTLIHRLGFLLASIWQLALSLVKLQTTSYSSLHCPLKIVLSRDPIEFLILLRGNLMRFWRKKGGQAELPGIHYAREGIQGLRREYRGSDCLLLAVTSASRVIFG